MRKQRRENICGMMAFATNLFYFYRLGPSHHPIFLTKYSPILEGFFIKLPLINKIDTKINILIRIGNFLSIF